MFLKSGNPVTGPRYFFFSLLFMSLYIASLNSGSNGNCYYIASQTDAVLVDVGISCREVERRMARLGLSPNKVRAVFITHEHTDHIKGLRVLSKKYRLPVYITGATRQHSGLQLEEDLVRPFRHGEEITIRDLSIRPFSKQHDCADPHSFLVSGHGVTIGVLTDIGQVCEQVINHFKQCHAVFLEANYDETMLETGAYPWYLKKRIRGGQGHLSNTQALHLFLNHRAPYLGHVLLSHLSRDNNDPLLVKELFASRAEGVRVTVASREVETELFHICPVTAGPASKSISAYAEQGVLFDSTN